MGQKLGSMNLTFQITGVEIKNKKVKIYAPQIQYVRI